MPETIIYAIGERDKKRYLALSLKGREIGDVIWPDDIDIPSKLEVHFVPFA